MGRVLFMVLALVVCCVPPVFINNVVGYLPLLMLVLGTLVSYVYLRVLVRSLEFSEASLLPSCERGSDVEFVIEFHNRSPLVFLRLEPTLYVSDLFGDVDLEFPTSLTLMPFERRNLKFAGGFDHIGTYNAGVSTVRVGDLFGLFSHTITNPNRHQVKVLPRVFDVSRVDLVNVSALESRKAFQPLSTDDMDYAGVRDYELGDPLKTIHWNLSARMPQGGYLTRLFETFTNPGVDIILDTSAPAYDHETLMFIFDAVVESALSVNEYAHEQGIDSSLRYFNRHGEETVTRILHTAEFEGLVADIPRINVDGGRKALEVLQREGNSIHGQSNIAFCTCQLSEELVSCLVELKLHKRNPLLFLAVPRSLEGEALKEFLRPLRRLDAAEIVYYRMTGAEGLAGEEAR